MREATQASQAKVLAGIANTGKLIVQNVHGFGVEWHFMNGRKAVPRGRH